ncbi:MAG: DEAD/DEAH box helicase family protein, partial [Phycisphaerae bacterium]
TGSGKTITAVSSIYRLIKFGGARRVLFLVDRTNLGEQAEKEFQGFRSPDDNRKFTELYNVQRLTTQTIGASTKVVITTIQRLYSMLRGEPEFDADNEDGSPFSSAGAGPAPAEALPVAYNRAIPPEFFDVIFVDECHRSIYSLWRQVLEYFDGFLVGLTATPAAHTYGFFKQNLVMEYGHEQAVADGVNVDFEVYRIRTKITEQGGAIASNIEPVLGKRDRRSRKVRWEAPDEPVTYTPTELDRAVVARDQIRTFVRTFRDRLFTEIFPGRTEVPKTLVFCKDDNHAEDVVDVLREEFAKGNEFCQKITYKVRDKKPADLIQEFRNSYYPRIA